jgi:hypothetical protein
MSYVFSLTPRMLTVTLACAGLLCVLLFLLGFQIGARLSEPPAPPPGIAAAASATSDGDAAAPKADRHD